MFCNKCGASVSEDSNFCTACGANQGNDFKPAGMGKRFLHSILDGLFLTLAVVVSGIILGMIGSAIGGEKVMGFPGVILICLFFFVLLLGYFIVMEYFWQRTPAKWMTGTKVVREDGGKPRFWQIVLRTLIRFIRFEFLSFLFNNNPVGWHDKWSKTMVVPQEYTQENIRTIDAKKYKAPKGLLICFLVIVGLFVLIFGTAFGMAYVKSRSPIAKEKQALYKQSKVDQENGKIKEASDELEKAIGLDKKDFYYPHNYELLKAERGLYDSSDTEHLLPLDIKITTLYPNNKFGWYNLGVTYTILGKDKEEVESFTKALDIDPTFEEARLMRAQGEEVLGEKDKACYDTSRVEVVPKDYDGFYIRLYQDLQKYCGY